jgi:hypothetical protein
MFGLGIGILAFYILIFLYAIRGHLMGLPPSLPDFIEPIILSSFIGVLCQLGLSRAISITVKEILKKGKILP